MENHLFRDSHISQSRPRRLMETVSEWITALDRSPICLFWAERRPLWAFPIKQFRSEVPFQNALPFKAMQAMEMELRRYGNLSFTKRGFCGDFLVQRLMRGVRRVRRWKVGIAALSFASDLIGRSPITAGRRKWFDFFEKMKIKSRAARFVGKICFSMFGFEIFLRRSWRN